MQKLNNKEKTIDVSKLYLFQGNSHKKGKKRFSGLEGEKSLNCRVSIVTFHKCRILEYSCCNHITYCG